METLGNKLSFKTYKSAKVNESHIVLPQPSKKDFYLDSSKSKLEAFAGDSYGISQDLVSFNEENANLYRSYTGPEDSCVLDIGLDDENSELIDIHDIVCESGDEISLVLNYESRGDSPKFRSSLIRIHAKENAKVNAYVISMDGKEVETMESIYLKIDEGARVRLCEYRLGGSKVTANTKAELFGDKAEAHIDSIYFGQGQDQLDLAYELIHHGEKSKSDLMVNGALKDQAFKVLRSTLDFKKGSKASDGSEEEHVILLSDDVRSQSVPVLLSGEDDVAGNHAASAGKLDTDLIFYIMSRGLSRAEAESLVINTRFASAIDSLDDEDHKEMIWSKVQEIMG